MQYLMMRSPRDGDPMHAGDLEMKEERREKRSPALRVKGAEERHAPVVLVFRASA